jgi:Putative zincin peptidase
MRLQLGDIPREEETSPEALGWHAIRSPAARIGYWLAALVGLALLSGLCAGLSMWSWAVGNRGGMATTGDAASPWIAMLIILAIFIPLHELLHLLGQPGWGWSSRSVVAVWPAKLRFGVYYEGCMTRRRWLAMRLAPLIMLSVLPACVLALLQVQSLSPDVEIGLQVLMVVNALGSGGDVVAAILVVAQVPPTACLCFQAGRAYWRPT